MKRSTLISVVLVSVLLMANNGFHGTTSGNQPVAAVWNIATGKRVELPVMQSRFQLDGTGHLSVFEVEVTEGMLASLVKSDQAYDSSRAVKVTIWMYYDKFTSGGTPWVSVDRYTTMWQLYDSSVSMSNARMNAGCYGYSWDGSPEECIPNQSQLKWTRVFRHENVSK